MYSCMQEVQCFFCHSALMSALMSTLMSTFTSMSGWRGSEGYLEIDKSGATPYNIHHYLSTYPSLIQSTSGKVPNGNSVDLCGPCR